MSDMREDAGKFAADQHRRVKELEAEVSRLRADFSEQKAVNRRQAERLAELEEVRTRQRRALSIIADTASIFDP